MVNTLFDKYLNKKARLGERIMWGQLEMDKAVQIVKEIGRRDIALAIESAIRSGLRIHEIRHEGGRIAHE